MVPALLTIPVTNKAIVLPELPGWISTLHTSTLVATLIAAAIAGLLALIVSVPLMRLVGIAAGIATVALLVIVQNVAQGWKAVTGGVGTLTGVPLDASLGMVLGWAIAAMAVAYLYQRTASGLRLRSAREDEVAARAIGVRVERERRIAFSLSAMVVGAGGSLYAHYVGAFGPENFYVQMTFLTLAMLIVGGMRSLAGAVVGTLVLSLVAEVLSRWESSQAVGGVTIGLPNGSAEILVAALLVLVLLLRPQGLLAGREIGLPRRRRGGDGATDVDRPGAGAGLSSVGASQTAERP
ncbi:MAG: branched-chain amino acid ABC transporter permease [Actinobacteria bacterium]|nr:branched-chain amino acid ABC transporter permease [Actinomycetota bacterium]